MVKYFFMFILLCLNACALPNGPIAPAIDYSQLSSNLLLIQYDDEVDNCICAVDRVKDYSFSSSVSYKSSTNSEIRRTKNGFKYKSNSHVEKETDDLAIGLLKTIDPTFTKSNLGLDLRAREVCRNTKYQTGYINKVLDTRVLSSEQNLKYDSLKEKYELAIVNYLKYVARGRN